MHTPADDPPDLLAPAVAARPAARPLAADDPFRVPTWRYDRVDALVKARATCRRVDDRFVRRTKAFLTLWAQAEGDPKKEEVAAHRYPDCYHAHRLHTGLTDTTRAALTSIVQARLLARQDVGEIAFEAGTSVAAILWYERVYYNVLDRIDRRDWVVSQVIAPALIRKKPPGASAFDVMPIVDPIADGTMKLFGYFGGPLLVDVMLSGFDGFTRVKGKVEFDAWFDQHWERTIRRRSTQAAMLFEVNRFNVTELFALHTRIMEIQNSPNAKRKSTSELQERVQAILSVLPYSPASTTGTDYRPGRVREFDAAAAELLPDELAAAGAGREVENEAEIRALVVPDARKVSPAATARRTAK